MITLESYKIKGRIGAKDFFAHVIIVILMHSWSVTNAQNKLFRHMTQRDGLPSGFIYKMIEDDKGFIWIASNRGISQYNGYEFINYLANEKDSTSINGSVATDIEQFDSHTMLVTTERGLEILDLKTGIFKLIEIPDNLPQPEVRTMDSQILPENGILVSNDKGVFYYPHLPSNGNDIIPKYFKPPTEYPVGSNLRWVMELDDNENVWVSLGDRLGKLNLEAQTFEVVDIADGVVQTVLKSGIWDIHKSKKGDLFISALSGLVHWKKGEKQPEVVSKIGELSENEIASASYQSITENDKGEILLGTGLAGLIVWNPSENTAQVLKHEPNNVNTVNSDDVHYAFEDRHGFTWLGYHEQGISLMYSNTFNYSYNLINPQNKTDTINALIMGYEDGDNTLWFTTPTAIIKRLENSEYKIFKPQDRIPPYGALTHITELNENELLVTRDSLLAHYAFDKTTEQFKKLSNDSIIHGFDFQHARLDENLYYGSIEGKIIKIGLDDFIPSIIDVPFPEGYSNSQKPVLPYVTEDNNLIIFEILLSTTAPPEFKIFSYDQRTNNITELPLDLENFRGFSLPTQSKSDPESYWIKGVGAIIKVNISTNEIQTFFEEDSGVLSLANPFNPVIEDNEGYLWLNTTTTILRLDPLTETINYYDLEDNRRPSNISPGRLLKNGNIIYPGNEGYIEFNPSELQYEGEIKNIHITEISSGSKNYSVLYNTVDLKFDPSDNNISISFIGLNYKDPNFTKYRYRIKGYDENWVNVGTQQRVFLANIPSGNYTFEVQAAPRFGSYTSDTATLEFKIPPPWWRTWPAYLLYAFILISSILLFDRVQRRRVIAKERERSREKELKQAREIELAYENLKATQKKLIHSEKMASLGELTAGIAHEIQNPLNFVNNFSELNQELADELEEELENGEIEEAKAIAKNIKENEQKINHHGKRADSIVKGMLQHSRNNAGEMHLTNINILADEYLRLAYHGLRAKDKSFNATLETNFDKKIGKIPLVAQDIGRVILNIINNALYAVKEKQTNIVDSDYVPTVTITTERKDKTVTISIQDNGIGIPDHVRDKIFQPFFTTKSAGQGTGLGLSMSYDIIKSHGGELIVDSEDGKGTLFKITLPTNQEVKLKSIT